MMALLTKLLGNIPLPEPFVEEEKETMRLVLLLDLELLACDDVRKEDWSEKLQQVTTGSMQRRKVTTTEMECCART